MLRIISLCIENDGITHSLIQVFAVRRIGHIQRHLILQIQIALIPDRQIGHLSLARLPQGIKIVVLRHEPFIAAEYVKAAAFHIKQLSASFHKVRAQKRPWPFLFLIIKLYANRFYPQLFYCRLYGMQALFAFL